MKKVILVDGNNLLFRSYFATAYTGNTMRNSKGFPTNGLYGLVNMLNKIIREEKPEYMLVAFDKGKTFRHEKYLDYKGGRNETPDDLKKQFSVAKKLVPLMGIKCFEIDNYEADDIIGTYSKMALIDPEFETTIVSSDKDLLQLINEETEVKLLKQKDYIRMNEETFIDTYGIKPIRMIDLKGLMGDASDNIPGVKGIGEKTALKLLQEYDSLENVYDNIDNIKGATKQKLIDGKESAFMSKDIATIYNEVPVTYSLEELKYDGPDVNGLREMYSDLEFYSFLKDFKEEEKKEELSLNNTEYLKGIWPVKSYKEISSPFGQRIHPITGKQSFHKGIDIPAPQDTDILSCDDGIISFSGVMNGYGNVIKIKHFDGKETLYAHNNSNVVEEGDVVKAGQVIAKVGTTGNSTGNHLHFETIINNENINPINVVN